MKCFGLVCLILPMAAGLAFGQQNHYSLGNVFMNFSEKVKSEEGDARHKKCHEVMSRIVAAMPSLFANGAVTLVGDWTVFLTYKFGDDLPDQKVIDVLAAEGRLGARVMPVYTLTVTDELNAETASKEILGQIAKAIHIIVATPAPTRPKPTNL